MNAVLKGFVYFFVRCEAVMKPVWMLLSLNAPIRLPTAVYAVNLIMVAAAVALLIASRIMKLNHRVFIAYFTVEFIAVGVSLVIGYAMNLPLLNVVMQGITGSVFDLIADGVLILFLFRDFRRTRMIRDMQTAAK